MAKHSLDWRLREKGMERFLSGEGIFDTHSHKPRPRYQELSRAQLRGILLWAIYLAQEQGKELRLYADEKKLLARIFNQDVKRKVRSRIVRKVFRTFREPFETFREPFEGNRR